MKQGIPRANGWIFSAFPESYGIFHENDISIYMKDAFGYEGEIAESVERMVELFAGLGIDMYFAHWQCAD